MGIEEYGVKPPVGGDKEKETTVKDILADKKQSPLFGEFIKTQPGGEERAKRLFNNESTDDDKKKLSEQQEQFLERQKEAEKLLKAFTPELISQLASKSDELKILVKLGGVEGVHGAIASQLEMLAMREPVRFNSMLDSYNDLLTKAEGANKQIEKICQTHGINSKQYLDVLANTPDEAERQKKLGDLMRPKMDAVKGWRQKTKEKNQKIQDEEVGEKAKDADYKWEIDQLRTEYDQELEQVGEVLAISINQDTSMSKAFMGAVLGEKSPTEEKFGGFKEMRGMMSSGEDVKKDWNTEWTAEKASRPSSNEDEFRNTFAAKKVGGKQGTWSDIVKEFIKKMAVV